MDPAAVLRPIIEAADQIRRLDDYQTQEELATAVISSVDALERSLRLRLRTDPATPDEHRVAALSADRLPLDEVVQSLRTRDLISIQAAGTLHEARAAAERARTGTVRAADADVVRSAVERVRREVGDAHRGRTDAHLEEAAGADEAGEAAGSGDPVEDTSPYTGRWMAWLAAAFATVFVIGSAWVVVRGGNSDQEDAVRAFRAGRYDSAAVAFERLLEDRPGNVTLMLFLGRSYRRLDRPADAAAVLRRAMAEEREDAAVRREMGHLFMDLGRPESAVAQYERAVEYGPDEPLNWAALIRALREMDDPRAEQMLREAPAELRAVLEGT